MNNGVHVDLTVQRQLFVPLHLGPCGVALGDGLVHDAQFLFQLG